MSPGPVRIPVPTAVVGVVIVFCAILLLKWLAVVALLAGGVAMLVRGMWRHRGRPLAGEPGPVGAGRQQADVELVLPEPRPADATTAPAAGGADCSWCGLRGGHRDLRDRLVRPRHAHARDLVDRD